MDTIDAALKAIIAHATARVDAARWALRKAQEELDRAKKISQDLHTIGDDK